MKTRKSAATIKAEILNLTDEVESLASVLETENREFTAAEKARFDELTAKGGIVDKLNVELHDATEFERARDANRERALLLSGSHGPNTPSHLLPVPGFPNGGRALDGGSGDRLAFRNAETGEFIHGRHANERLFAPAPTNMPSFGEMMAAVLTGDDRHLGGKTPPMMASTATGPGGGYFVPHVIGSELIDLARPAMVTAQAGVQTIGMPGPDLRIVRATADPVGSYVPELGNIPASNPSFGTINLSAKKHSTLIPLSREVIEDAVGLPGAIQSMAVAAVAQVIDRAVLIGEAAGNGPMGIATSAHTTKVAGIGTPNYADAIDAVRRILAANHPGAMDRLSWVMNPREWATYAGLVSTGAGADGQPLQAPPALDALRRFTTTQIDGRMIVGDFSAAVLGIRSGVQVEVLNGGSATDAGGLTLDAVSNDCQFMRITVRFDVGIMRPTWFVVLDGVTA
jgi:HK97 family phage major capsid protein